MRSASSFETYTTRSDFRRSFSDLRFLNFWERDEDGFVAAWEGMVDEQEGVEVPASGGWRERVS